MVKLLLGLVKGLVIGAAVGFGAFQLWPATGGGLNYVTYGAIGALVGLLVGRPIWSNILDKEATSWVSILKAVFGFGVGCGIYALVDAVWGGFAFEADFLGQDLPATTMFQHIQPLFGAALGAVYGAFVELDDSVDDSKRAPKKLAAPAPSQKKPEPKS